MKALVLVALVATQAPSPVAERIARGEALLAELDYLEAADELTRAAADPSATDDERVRANLLAGVANRIAGRDVEARLCFRYVLLRAPDTALPPDTSPKVADFYGLVRQEIDAERGEPRARNPQAPAAQDAAATAPAATPPAADGAGPPGAAPSLVPLAVTGVGLVTLAAGGALALGGELALADAARDGVDKEPWQVAGRVGLLVAAVGAVAAGVGGALFLVE